MKQEFEWHEIKKSYEEKKDDKTGRIFVAPVDKNTPSKPGAYLVITNNGAFQVKRYDGESFSGVHKYLAWAEIPSTDNLNIMSKEQRHLAKVCEQIKALEIKKKELEHKIYEANKDKSKAERLKAEERAERLKADDRAKLIEEYGEFIERG